MAIDNGALVQNSGDGTINLHGTVVGGNGNQVSITHAAESAPGAAELLRLLTAVRLTAAASADLPAHLQTKVVAGAAEAQRLIAAGDMAYAGEVLLRTRAELEPESAGRSGASAALRSMLDSALDLVPDTG